MCGEVKNPTFVLCNFIKINTKRSNVTMKSKSLFRIFVLLVVLLSAFGSSQPAMARSNLQEPPGTVVITRELTYWDATYTGYVDSTRYEKWPFVFTESNDFYVTATPTSGSLTPLLILLDGSGTEITRGTGTITSTQPAGNYSVQVQPESGYGFYELIIRRVDQGQGGSVTAEVTPTSVTVGESAVVSINLNDVPVEGYASAEFTCTYPVGVVEVSNIAVTGLFGTDPAVAIHDPQDGSFIVAIAGSNGQKATAAGTAFTFSVATLQVGQALIECDARVSFGTMALRSLMGRVQH